MSHEGDGNSWDAVMITLERIFHMLLLTRDYSHDIILLYYKSSKYYLLALTHQGVEKLTCFLYL